VFESPGVFELGVSWSTISTTWQGSPLDVQENGQVRGVRKFCAVEAETFGEEQLPQALPLIQRNLDPQATRVGHQGFGERQGALDVELVDLGLLPVDLGEGQLLFHVRRGIVTLSVAGR
jgi:hypothetical protein